ncbi:hypothetical protein [Chromobacterium aquaticum]|uniref:Uncharacterized protein n=1 Tax=Chromobacterium aquaticum TaxID=467180 RepID=A0ABV8ZQB8_9NEIS|nr:hypothetical protein [Chromobacterium aquaticum]MCD5360113.1 hypothetical protein [Chromobacterium aquaticum]
MALEMVMSVLFAECLQALGGDAKVISACEAEVIFSDIGKKFQFSVSGSLQIGDGCLSKRGEARKLLDEFNKESGGLYIFWDDAAVPVLEIPASCISKIISCIDDVLAVGFKTYIYQSETVTIMEVSSFGTGLLVSHDSAGEV